MSQQDAKLEDPAPPLYTRRDPPTAVQSHQHGPSLGQDHPIATSQQPQASKSSAGPGGKLINFPTKTYKNATSIAQLGRFPVVVDCARCSLREVTRVKYKIRGNAHLFAIMMIPATGGLLSLTPYIFDFMKDADHYCGCCGALLATNKACKATMQHQFA